MGHGQQDLIWLLIGELGLALCAWGLIGALLLSVLLRQQLSALSINAPVEMECDRAGFSGFSLNATWWLPFIQASWVWTSPQAKISVKNKGLRIVERVVPLRRGVVDGVWREVSVGDAFGLVSFSWLHHHPGPVRILPSTGALKDVALLRGMAGGESHAHPEGDLSGDRIDMRRYGKGDSIRFVLWKVYARSRQLMVRTPERAMSPTQEFFAYLVSTPGDQAAAGAAWVAAQTPGGVWGADGVLGSAEDTRSARELILRSSDSKHAFAGQGLRAFVEERLTRRVVVFVPPSLGEWVRHVQSIEGVEFAFVVGVDGSRSRLRDLRGLVAALQKCSSHVVVADRKTGLIVPAEQLR